MGTVPGAWVLMPVMQDPVFTGRLLPFLGGQRLGTDAMRGSLDVLKSDVIKSIAEGGTVTAFRRPGYVPSWIVMSPRA
jgi:hypothetical protein